MNNHEMTMPKIVKNLSTFEIKNKSNDGNTFIVKDSIEQNFTIAKTIKQGTFNSDNHNN